MRSHGIDMTEGVAASETVDGYKHHKLGTNKFLNARQNHPMHASVLLGISQEINDIEDRCPYQACIRD